MKITKYKIKKIAFSAMMTVPMFVPAILMSATTENESWQFGETVENWIYNPRNNIKGLNQYQKVLLNQKNTNEVSKAEIKKLDNLMYELAEQYYGMNAALIYKTIKFSSNYHNSDKQELKRKWISLRPEYTTFLITTKTLDTKIIKNKLTKIYTIWNQFEGLAKIFKARVDEKRFLNSAQKENLKNEIDNIDAAKRITTSNQVNDTYLEKLQKHESKVNNLNAGIEELQLLINEYTMKTLLWKYWNSTQAKKEAFMDALKKAKVEQQFYNHTEPEKIALLKKQLLKAYYELDAYPPEIKDEFNLKEKLIADFFYLSVEAKFQFTKQLNDLATSITNPKTFKKESDWLINQISNINKAFASLKNSVVVFKMQLFSERAQNVTNNVEQEEKVYQALDSVLLDPHCRKSKTNTIRRPANGMHIDFDISHLKFKPGVDYWKIIGAVRKIDSAGWALIL
ncbi:hypothetical protein ACW95P_02630 [Candidatus Mycoplasma pogonae]